MTQRPKLQKYLVFSVQRGEYWNSKLQTWTAMARATRYATRADAEEQQKNLKSRTIILRDL
jgi:hypothetical protein